MSALLSLFSLSSVPVRTRFEGLLDPLKTCMIRYLSTCTMVGFPAGVPGIYLGSRETNPAGMGNGMALALALAVLAWPALAGGRDSTWREVETAHQVGYD